MKTALIILAGGQGARFASTVPKQFLMLSGKPVVMHSLHVFEKVNEIDQVVIVLDPNFRHYVTSKKPLGFALPGLRRQDSLFNGMQGLQPDIEFVLVHDAARPFITLELIRELMEAGQATGAACAAMPIKFTVKEASREGNVQKTLDRNALWEIQTPQIARKDLLQKGFAYAQKLNLTVTDDVGLVELIDHPVRLVKGNHRNIKITTPEDWQIALSYSQNA